MITLIGQTQAKGIDMNELRERQGFTQETSQERLTNNLTLRTTATRSHSAHSELDPQRRKLQGREQALPKEVKIADWERVLT